MKSIVSVIMITYNQESFISDSIIGVLNQKTTFKFELLIADDGSQDSTREIIQTFFLKHPSIIKPIFRSKNIGANSNWYDAYKQCEGKFIAICEGDDYWIDPYKLQKQVDFLESNTDYVLTFHKVKPLKYNGKEYLNENVNYFIERDLTQIDLMKGPWILPVCLLFRKPENEIPREVFSVVNSDKFLVSYLGQFGKGKYLNNVEPSIYRIHDGGTWSQKTTIQKVKSSLDTVKKMKCFYNTKEHTIHEYYTNLYLEVIDYYYYLSCRSGKFVDFIDSLVLYTFNNNNYITNKIVYIIKSSLKYFYRRIFK